MIREATTRDIPFMVEEGKNFFKYSMMDTQMDYNEVHVSEFLERNIDSGSVKLFISERNDKLTGFIGGIVISPFYNQNHKILMEFIWWTTDEGRGNGDGIRLLFALEKWGAKMGANSSSIDSIENHLSLQTSSMLRRLGYSKIEQKFMKKLEN